MKYKAVVALVATLRDTLDLIPHQSRRCIPASLQGPTICSCNKRIIHERINELQDELAKEDLNE